MTTEIIESEEKVLKLMAEARIKIKALLSVETVELSEELAELLRWRMLTWSRVPPLMRKLMLPFLTTMKLHVVLLVLHPRVVNHSSSSSSLGARCPNGTFVCVVANV